MALSDYGIKQPYSRLETFLAAAAGESVPIPEPPYNRFELFLLNIIENGGGGGGGRTTNYNELAGKPQINGITLTGNQSAADLSLVPSESGKGLSESNFTQAEKDKLAGIEAGAEANPGVATEDATGLMSAADKKALESIKNLLSEAVILRTASGSPAFFSDGYAGADLRKLAVTIQPVQDLHGYDTPWPPGGSKNLLDVGAPRTVTDHGVTFTILSNGTVIANGQNDNTNASSLQFNFPLEPGEYTLSGCPSGGSAGNSYSIIKWAPHYTGTQRDIGNGATFTVPDDEDVGSPWIFRIAIESGYSADNLLFKPMVRPSQTSGTFVPYSNICPVTGRSSVTVTRTGENGSSPQTVTVSTGTAGTVYGGVLDVTTGALSVTTAYKSLTGSDIISSYSGSQGNSICVIANDAKLIASNDTVVDNLVSSHLQTVSGNAMYSGNLNSVCVATERRALVSFADLTTQQAVADYLNAQSAGGTPVQVVYPLETTISCPLTPQQIAALSGYNAVSADAGPVDVEYRAAVSF